MELEDLNPDISLIVKHSCEKKQERTFHFEECACATDLEEVVGNVEIMQFFHGALSTITQRLLQGRDNVMRASTM